MQNILKLLLPFFLIAGCLSCDTLETTQFPINALSLKQHAELNSLLDRKSESGKGKGIYKSNIDTIANHTVLHITYSDKQTDLSDLTSFLIGEDLINKSYISPDSLQYMVRQKEIKDSLEILEELEKEAESEIDEVNKTIEPIVPVKVKDLIPVEDSTEVLEDSVSVNEELSNSNMVVNPDSI